MRTADTASDLRWSLCFSSNPFAGSTFTAVAVFGGSVVIFPFDVFTSLLVITFFVDFFFGPPLAFAALTSGESSGLTCGPDTPVWAAPTRVSVPHKSIAINRSFFMALTFRRGHSDLRAARRRRAPEKKLRQRRYLPSLPFDESFVAECERP